MTVEQSGHEIFKPRTDKREYRRIVLSNSLEALLISDPDTDKAAASMDVSVGSYSDPVGLEGLAHFLEHMLFYASEKYPVEDSYSKYIAELQGIHWKPSSLYSQTISLQWWGTWVGCFSQESWIRC